MNQMKAKKVALKEKFLHEMHLYLIYAAFLMIFFTAFSTYRRLVLEEYSISYIHHGYNLIESLILAKLILVGQALHLGEKFSDRSLIIPSFYKAVIFSLFVLAFTILEHFIDGFLHKKSIHESFEKLINVGLYQIFAQVFIMFFVFLFFFAFLEVNRVLGEGKLFKLFFQRK